MAACNLFVVVSSITFLLFILGIHNYLTLVEENSCAMTYMFEYPQYVRISLPENEASEFPKYALYAYGEGQYTERLRSMQFTGIPVLFIPGNSGSYKQVRSLASVALRKARDMRAPFHFNFFAADLNEEHSALFGGVLPEQTRFISRCIRHILTLYQNYRHSPSTVILFGHSMGGMIAKGVFLEPDFIPGSVHTVLTLATPHVTPVIELDRYVAAFYHRINTFWEQSDPNVLLVSVGGGHRDLLIRSGLTLHGNISTLTTAIPGVWVSADHLCILWCKQFVLTLARALFDSVDLHSKQISTNPTIRHRAFSYHLLNRNSGKRVSTVVYPKDYYFEQNAEWHEYLRRQFSITKQDLKNPLYVMVRLMGPQYSNHEVMVAETVGLDARDWVFACVADRVYKEIRMCETGYNLSNMTQFLPSLNLRRKTVHVYLHELKLKGYTHVVIRFPVTNNKVQVNVDVFDTKERVKEIITLPNWFSQTPVTLVESTSAGALHYRLLFPTLKKVWHTSNLQLVTNCNNQDQHAIMTLATEWSKEDSHAFVTNTIKQELPMKLQSMRTSAAQKNDIAYVILHLHPSCSYTVSIKSSIPMVFGQLVRFYSSQLPAYLAAVLLLTLRAQLNEMVSGNSCRNFHSALANGARPYIFLPIIKIIVTILSAQKLLPLSKFLPISDWQWMQTQGLDILYLPVLLYMVASFTAYMLAVAVWAVVIIWGTTINNIILKFISRSFFGRMQISEWILSIFAKVPCIVACLLVTLAYSTCGAVALSTGLCFYFLLVVKTYQEFLEEQFKIQLYKVTGMGPRDALETTNRNLSALHFRITGLMFWAIITSLVAPSAIAWAHSFKYSPRLHPDPSFVPAILLFLCAPLLWQRDIPRINLMFHKEVDIILITTAALCVMFATISLYRLVYFIVIALMLVCLQQMLAKSLNSSLQFDDAIVASTVDTSTTQIESDVMEKPKQS